MNDLELHISRHERELVLQILDRVVPNLEVLVFGSRAGGQPNKFSDLDLAILCDKPIGLSVMAELTEAFSESDLPYKVDIIDWSTTNDSFRKIIQDNCLPLKSSLTSLHGGKM